jgi:hypothetical protein
LFSPYPYVLSPPSSPIGSLEVRPGGRALVAVVRTRQDLPAYTLKGYRLRWTAYGRGGIPLERKDAPLPDLAPGTVSETPLGPKAPDSRKVVVEVVRPTGFSAAAAVAKL